jgi:hypothetical protein
MIFILNTQEIAATSGALYYKCRCDLKYSWAEDLNTPLDICCKNVFIDFFDVFEIERNEANNSLIIRNEMHFMCPPGKRNLISRFTDNHKCEIL